MKKRKTKSTLLVASILAVVSFFLIYTSTKSTLKNAGKDFAIDDTSSVTKIFLSDKENRMVKLEKQPRGGWTLNDSITAKYDAISMLLTTMMAVEVKEPIAKAGRNNVIKRLASIGVKVEIYQKRYRIDLWGLKLFPFEKCTRTYYVGDATQDMLGTYMLMEDSKEPYVVHIPGFNGFLYSRYSTKEEDWRDHSIINLRLSQIKTFQLEFPLDPELSYKITNYNNRKFGITSLKGNKEISDFDTVKVLEVLSSCENIKYESLLNDMQKKKKDSLLLSPPFHIITITDLSGNKFMIKTYHIKANEGEVDVATNEPIFYNRDRMYALINNGKDLVLIQFFVFDRLIQPLPHFKKKDSASTK
jgi:hypothetical protein